MPHLSGCRHLVALLALLLVTFTGGTPPALAPAAPARAAELDLAPQPRFGRTSIEIVRNLQRHHYRRVNLDDAFSNRVFENYLADLDASHLHFNAADIAGFEHHRYQLDDALTAGDLAPAYTIYNRYLQRLEQRITYVLDQLACCLADMDFTAPERILADRRQAPWPFNRSDQTNLWRKRVKHEVLSLILDDQDRDRIRETLTKRYQARLNRLGQTTSEDVFRLYMNSLTRSYDPHTQYFPPRDSENFNIRMSLSLEGIGAILQNDDEYTKVVSLVAGGPADKAGELSAGDRIVGVAQGPDGDMTDVIGWRIDDVVQLIRGPKGTVVRLRIIPHDAEDVHVTRVVRITRDTVRLEDQAASQRIVRVAAAAGSRPPRTVGVIEIPTFYVDFNAQQAGERDYRSTTRDVHRLLDELQRAGVEGVIIDLRNNGGGSLQEVNTLVGLFIDRGPTVQVRSARGISAMADRDRGVVYDGPLGVLVNRTSASASEIFAGAIQDYGRGVVLGSQTFGKGTVQHLLNLSEGQLKLTVAKFYRISGDSTQHRGILPDIRFPSPIDPDEIGESALEQALPWDRIDPIKGWNARPLGTAILAELDARHRQRIVAEPDFAFFRAEVAELKQRRGRKHLSLQEAVRRHERRQRKAARLERENTRRRAKGLPVLDSLEADEAPADDESEPADAADPLLRESARILIDYIDLTAAGP